MAETAPRIAIVTGANAGLGYETARAFAGRGLRVVMACRDGARGAAAAARIRAEHPRAAPEVMALDLADLASVRAFCDAFRARHGRLDILVNNAGIMWVPRALSPDGFEMHMAANHFGHALLTAELLELMPDSAASRIVAVSSVAHRFGERRIRFEDIHWQQGYTKTAAYAQSKLACLMFANALDRRLRAAGRRILSVAAHPGASATELGRHLPRAGQALARLLVPFIAQSAEAGARPQIMAALDPAIPGGAYLGPQGFQEMRGPPGPVPQAPWAADATACDRLWELSAELTGARWPFQTT